jgi:hypothetical protein
VHSHAYLDWVDNNQQSSHMTIYFLVAGNPDKVWKWKNTDHAQHATKEILNDMPSISFRVVQMLSDLCD